MMLATTRRCCLWALVLVALAAPAASAKPKLAILGIEAVGAVDPALTDLAKDLTVALRGRAATGKLTLLPSKRELVDEKLMSNCQTMALQCMGQIANNLGADFMLYGQLEKLPRKGAEGYHVTLWLLEVTKSPQVAGDLYKNPSGQNPIDEWRPAKSMGGAALEKWVDSVYGRLAGDETEKAPAKLAIHVTNARIGTVYVNGTEKGQLDDGRITLSLSPDQSYQLAIEADGFQRYEQQVKATSGQTETAEFELVRTDGPPPPPHGGTSKAKFIWAGAGALVGSGIVWAVFAREFYGPIQGYKRRINDADAANNPFFVETNKPLDSSSCGNVNLNDEAVVNAMGGKKEYLAACDAKRRQLWEGIAGGVLAVVGGGLVLYGVIAKDTESPRPIALRPMMSPEVAGAMLDIRW